LMNESPGMQQINQTFNYLQFESEEELTGEHRELLRHAREACISSYAPYSQYHVGAAVRMTDGSIMTGSNQENMSFPAGICAERVALFAAASKFPGIPIKSMAISARSDLFAVTEPVTPCGICRQALLEYELKYKTGIQLILAGQKGKVYLIEGVQNLLPLAFVEKGLLREK